MKYVYDRNSVIIKDTSQVQFQETQYITMKAIQYNPVAGRAFRPLPPFLAKKEINTQYTELRREMLWILYLRLSLEA